MRKITALILCLLFCCACALAEEATRVEFGDTFSLMRPADLEVVELGEDEASESMVYAATSDSLEMYVWAYDMDGLSADELYEMWREDDFLEDVTTSALGDFQYLTYSIVDEGLGAVFACGDGKYYDFIFYCESDEAIAQARAILDSVSLM